MTLSKKEIKQASKKAEKNMKKTLERMKVENLDRYRQFEALSRANIFKPNKK